MERGAGGSKTGGGASKTGCWCWKWVLVGGNEVPVGQKRWQGLEKGPGGSKTGAGGSRRVETRDWGSRTRCRCRKRVLVGRKGVLVVETRCRWVENGVLGMLVGGKGCRWLAMRVPETRDAWLGLAKGCQWIQKGPGGSKTRASGSRRVAGCRKQVLVGRDAWLGPEKGCCCI